MLPPFPSSRITPIDEGSPLRKPDDIPEEPLISSPPKFFIDENMQHVLSSLKKQKDKKQKAYFGSSHLRTSSKKIFGWSQEEVNQAFKESIRIQA